MKTSASRNTIRPFAALYFAVILSLFSGTAFAQKKAATDSEEHPRGKEYVYKVSAGKERKMEIYFPPNHDPKNAKVPGLILFHGGGWSGGSLDQFRVACAYFASRGLVCATAEYQMLDKAQTAKLPKGVTKKRVCVTDAKSAIRWFKQNAGELGIDPQRIITGGGSAGGHISALATMSPGLDDPADPKGINTDVIAYLWFNPAFAPTDKSDAEVDILRHMKKDIAPSIVFFGDKDEWKEGWDTAFQKWREMGTKNIDERIAEGQGHSFFNKEPWRSVTLIEADKFLTGLGLLKGEPTLKAPPSGEKLVKSSKSP
ncbi:MAG: alpha/beta hydrolase [Verrucomicrobiales bacterium]